MSAPIDSKALIRRTLFLAILVGLAITYLTFTFKGLTSKYGMDQAQIGREVARGNNLTTKFVRPLALFQLQETGKKVDINHFYDTTHAPLNILIYAGVIKAFGGDDFERYKMTSNQEVYTLDRVIAGTCMVFFMIAIGINYLLVTKIFDAKIGTIVAILMMVSDNLWGYTNSGLPQMLMLCIFSGACYLLWKAIDSQESGRSPLAPVILCGFLFGLLALAHWLTLWIFLGFLVFSIFYFRPRGVVASFLIITMALFIAGPMIFNAKYSDGIMGTAFFYVQGKTGLAQDYMFRGFQYPTLDVRNIVWNTFKTTLNQAHGIHHHVGGFVLATAFFLSLLHPFKRNTISNYRWCILIMWIFASLGMAIYGLDQRGIEPDPNQMHILFMPLMSAFALALISILWARLPLSQNQGFISLIPFTIIIIIAASPMMIQFGNELNQTKVKNVKGYYPNIINREIPKFVEPTDAVYSDQPSAIAWYADRIAIWTPGVPDQLAEVSQLAEDNNTNIVSFTFSAFTPQPQLRINTVKVFDRQYEHYIPLKGNEFILYSKNKPKKD